MEVKNRQILETKFSFHSRHLSTSMVLQWSSPGNCQHKKLSGQVSLFFNRGINATPKKRYNWSDDGLMFNCNTQYMTVLCSKDIILFKESCLCLFFINSEWVVITVEAEVIRTLTATSCIPPLVAAAKARKHSTRYWRPPCPLAEVIGILF